MKFAKPVDGSIAANAGIYKHVENAVKQDIQTTARHDAVMRQRADRDKAKQHTERKGRKATAKKAAPEESEDSSSDTDVGSELATLSASFADAVTRVGKRASAKTMKGLRANATPMGHTSNKHAAEGLEWVNDPGIWIFMGSGICTA